MSSDRRIQYLIVPNLKSTKEKTFLDVGCGFGVWGYKIRAYSNNSYLIGIDIWKPYLLQTKRKCVYDDLVIADASHLPFREKSIDITLACEVIEHIHDSKTATFLFSLETITKEKLIVSTPNYEYLQSEIHGNPYEKHISFLKHSTFPKKYKISGVGFQIESKIFLNSFPFFGYLLSRLVLFGMFCRFSEMIVATIDLAPDKT
jgi:SAM-dependent methyltransferase